MKNLLNQNDKFSDGFKKDSAAVDNMFILVSIIQQGCFMKKPLYIAFVDFWRAFDIVNRSIMFYKLINKKIDGKLIRLLHNVYETTKGRICLNGVVPDFLCDTRV